MSDIQLFRLNCGAATELSSRAAPLEKTLQTLIEAQMEILLGVRCLATEYTTGKMLCLRTAADLARAKPLIERSYIEN